MESLERYLIIHSDEVEKWGDLRDPSSKAKHLEVIGKIRGSTKTVEITSEFDPATVVDFFQPGDKVTIFGQSNGSNGCVTRALKALQEKGVEAKLSDIPFSTLPWPPNE